ncbi:MAG: hypothetical protein ACR2QF_13485 [Geminicoccaceae bacterium]
MSNPSLDQAVIHTMNELMRASSDCAEFDPAMSAKLATAAKDMGRDLGIALVKPDPLESVASEHDQEPDDDETRDLLYLLDLQKRAIAEVETEGPPKSRLSWLGLDVWSRW